MNELADNNAERMEIPEAGAEKPSYLSQYNYKLNYLQRFIRQTIVYTLFMLDLDPFLIYKFDSSNPSAQSKIHNQKVRSHNLEEFKIDYSHWDKWRGRWRLVFVSLNIYFIAKFTLITIVQWVLRRYSMRVSRLGSKFYLSYHNPAHHNLLHNGSNYFQDQAETSIILDYSLWLSSSLGNPYSALYGISMFINLSLAINLIHSIVWLPIYYKCYQPMDALHLRILLSPIREIKRIDYMIEEKLNYILFIVRLKLLTTNNLTLCNQVNTNYVLEQNFNELKRIAVDLKSNHIDLMRPAAFNIKFQKNHFKTVLICILLAISITIPWLFYLPRTLINSAINERCRIIKRFQANFNYPEQCTFKYIFSAQDVWYLFEVMLAVVALGFLFIIEISMILANVSSQLETVMSMKADLELCLRSLDFCESINHDNDLLGPPSDNLLNDKTARSELMLDSILLRTFIKIRISEEDIRKNNVFVSQWLTSLTGIIGTLLAMIILGGNVRNEHQEIKTLRMAILVWSLLVVNLTLLSCAYAFARTADIAKLAWSALAQMLIRSERRKREFYSDFIAISWCKLVDNQAVSENHNSIKLFNMMSVRYRSIIEANFVLISVVSLLRSFS